MMDRVKCRWKQMPPVSNEKADVKESKKKRQSIIRWSVESGQNNNLHGNVLSENEQRVFFYECHSQMKVITVKTGTNTRNRKWYLHRLVDNSGFFQQILGYLCSDHCSTTVELHFQVLAEAAGVVIDDSAGISKCLHQAVDQQDLLLECPVIGLNKISFHFSLGD